MIHIGSGIPGAQRAAETKAIAVVVDALRASASLCAMVLAGAEEILVCPSADIARDLATEYPDAILAGEWKSQIPEGFDYDNSPILLSQADIGGKTVIFTSTNGARMLCAARGAEEVYVGSVVNASPLVHALQSHVTKGKNIVIIAAGDQDRECDEDMASAALLAESTGPDIDPSQEVFVPAWCSRIAGEGLEQLFLSAEHGVELIQRARRDDVVACATPDAYPALPRVVGYFDRKTATIARISG